MGAVRLHSWGVLVGADYPFTSDYDHRRLATGAVGCVTVSDVNISIDCGGCAGQFSSFVEGM